MAAVTTSATASASTTAATAATALSVLSTTATLAAHRLGQFDHEPLHRVSRAPTAARRPTARYTTAATSSAAAAMPTACVATRGRSFQWPGPYRHGHHARRAAASTCHVRGYVRRTGTGGLLV